MIIRKNQWHYKAIDRFGTKSAKDRFYYGCHTTCSYIRALVWSLVMSVVFLAFISAVISVLTFCVVSAIAAPIQLAMGLPFVKGTLAGAFYVFGALTWSAAAITGACAVLATLAALYQNRRPSAQEKADIIKAAYKDKVDGICTLVTLEK